MKLSIKDFPIYASSLILIGFAIATAGNILLEDKSLRVISDLLFGAGMLIVLTGFTLLIYCLFNIKKILKA